MEDNCPIIQGCQVDDKLLIESFTGAGYKGEQLRRLNLCRLYLQAVSLGDIVTGCGKYITVNAWAGIRDTTRPSRYSWPNQGKLSPNDWILWQIE